MKRGTIPADGKIWTSCTTPGVVALTFDDGPFQYTQKIVDDLTKAGHKATFFQNGQNYDSIYTYADVLKSMIAGGHQVASHTWSHADLSKLDAAGVTNEMTQLETAQISIIGKASTYMRPPYLALGDVATSTLKSLGYRIINVDIDTQDWAEAPAGTIQNSIDWYKGNQTNGGTMSLNHDVYEPTADVFVPAIIEYLASKNLKSVTVGECIGDDEANWYKSGTASSSSSAPSQSSTPPPSSSGSSGSPGHSATGSTSPTPSGSGKPTDSGSGGPKPTGGSGSGGHGGSGGNGGNGSGSGSGGHGGSGDSGSGSGWKPGKPVKGGDTEPGHGPNAGRGAIPGHSGTGNDGWSGSSDSGSGSGSGSGYGSGSGAGGHGSSGSSGSGNGSPSYVPSGVKPQPSYYTNGASGLTGSAVVIGAAALALVL